jgi:hypothetical protein
MNCEHCSEEHDGSYGSGRFCRSKCARAFSTAAQRDAISAKVSASLTGRPIWNGKGFQKGNKYSSPESWTQERKKKLSVAMKELVAADRASKPWEALSRSAKKAKVISEQGGKCVCGLSEWRGKRLILELHHKDGVNTNDTRENLEVLCPNCHSVTETYRANRWIRLKLGPEHRAADARAS